MNEEILLNDELLEEELELEEVDVEKNKRRAERRKNTYVKNRRQKTIQGYQTDDKSTCPEEKRLRKKVCVRKARYYQDELAYGDYKKCAKMTS
jgi:hypothetical protein